MAVAIVSLAVERISDLLINQALFLKDVKEQVKRLRDELKYMQYLLEDADRLPEQDERFRDWVSDIRDLALDAEDVIDSFILEAANGHAHERGFHGVVKRFTSIFTKPSHLHELGMRVKELQTKLENISKSLSAYGIPGDGAGSSSVSSMQQRLRRTFSHVDEDDVVSLEISTKDVLALLMTEEDRTHAVVSIVGMGGIGKTTLARKVYNHVDVKRHFDCMAWVYISRQCNRREVWLDILTKVLSPSKYERELIEKEREEDLAKKLFDVLKEKRYLIVLDDIWTIEDLDILKPAFPRGKKGNKILLTTRNCEVALNADPCNSPIKLAPLTDDESWELFIRKAFLQNKTDTHAWSDAFAKLGIEMVKKCGGLPLAIVVLGGLLATKHSLPQWEMVHKNIFQEHLKGFQQQSYPYDAVNEILGLSYNDLPYHLKSCFLYLGNYPQDWEISKKELIQLWIAEGLIPPLLESEDMLEDVGELFLEKLISRNLVEVVRRDYTGTAVKTCRINDVSRNLCIVRAKEEKFLEIVVPPLTESGVTLAEPMLRRIAIHPSKRYVCCLKGEHPKLRSLFLFQNEALIELDISKLRSFKFLRVLNLVRMDVYKWHVSSEIGNLHHLRYLRLEGAVIIILPRAIGRLKSLHTLYLRHHDDGYFVIPDVLFKLERLRHIVFQHPHKFWYSKEVRWQPRSFSKNIETLKYIVVDEKLIENNAVCGLTNIRRLGIVFKRLQDMKPILISLKELRRLASLQVKFKRGLRASYQDLEDLSQCGGLTKLELVASIKEGPQWSHHVLNFLPPNIVKLTLSGCGMKQDPMSVLGQLPKLRILRLQYGAYKGSEMICSARGFPVLDFLHMSDLELKKWEIKEGAMPCLQSLHLKHVVGLRMIPEGLKYITTLQELKLISVYSSLAERIDGEDSYKIVAVSVCCWLGVGVTDIAR